MCTVSWVRTEAGLEVFFSRDERRERAPEEPLQESVAPSGGRILAPRDGEAGGTWFGVADAGLAMGILNYVGAVAERDDLRSRGLLLLDLLGAPSTTAVRSALAAADLARHRPFRVVVFRAEGEPRLFTWDGRTLSESVPVAPLVSSGFRPGTVGPERVETWRAMGPPDDRAGLLAFHRSHLPEAGPASVCMHREEAATRSLVHAVLGRDAVVLRHHPAPPCRPTAWAEASLPLAAPATPTP